ncbi:hypothetical protein NDU88_005782 [Pleurodeles waltl]|uniref:SURP motif domain-containing protein n=1 Tax=Pleurodeles waltl TaxID=8319 RepID=A0AAV7L5L5_PLEWA|nr:hypothetical protein NDU88_005782 [Pleurodeles waltl]
MAASDLRGLSGPQLQFCKSDFLGKEQRLSDSNSGIVRPNEGPTSLALRIDSQRSGIPVKSNEQSSNSQPLAPAKDAKNDVIFLGYSNRAQLGNLTESSKQASISSPAPWHVVSKQGAPSQKLPVNPQLGFPSLKKDQISSPTESSKQIGGRPPPWRLDSKQDTPSITHAAHPQLGFPVISKGQPPYMYSPSWSMDSRKVASSTQDTHIQQSGFPVVSKGQPSTIYPLPLSINNSNKGASSMQVTHVKRSVIPPGTMGQAPNSFPVALRLDGSKGASSIKDTNVHQVGLSGESKGQSPLTLSMAVTKQVTSIKQADPPQLAFAKSLSQPFNSRTELKGKDHVQVTSSSGHTDHRTSASPAPKIAKAGLAHVMYETIMQEMVGSYEVTEESLAKMALLGIPKPDPTKPTRRKHSSTSRSRSRPLSRSRPRSLGRDTKTSLLSHRRRSRSPRYRSSYRNDLDRRKRRSASSKSSSSEERRRKDRKHKSRSRDRTSRRNRSRSRSRNRSRKKADNLDKKSKKKEAVEPSVKTPTVAMIGKKPVDPKVVNVIRSLLAYNFKNWRVKDYQGEKPEFWYLFDESSVEYQYYRLKLSELQKLKKSIKDAMVQGDSCQTSPGEFSNESMRAVALAKELAEVKQKLAHGQILVQKETATVGMQTGLDHLVQERPVYVVQHSQNQLVKEQTVPCVEQSISRPAPAGEAEKPEVLAVEAKKSENQSVGAEKPQLTTSGAPEKPTSLQPQFPELDASTKETAENLARFLVEVGPEIDGGFDLGILSENPEFWFLNEKESPAYKFYHMKLTAFCESSGVSYVSVHSSHPHKAASQDAKPQPSKHQDPGALSIKPPVNKVGKSDIIEILDSDSEDSGSQKTNHHDSEPLAAESQDSEPEEPEPKASEPKGFDMQGPLPRSSKPKEPEPQGSKPQKPVNQSSEHQDSGSHRLGPQQHQPDETELLVTCCSEDDQSDSEDPLPPTTQHKVELQPVVLLDLQNSQPLVEKSQLTPPEEPKDQPEVVQPQHPVCHDGLEPMADMVSSESVEETETEPAESTASEEAAQTTHPTQPSTVRKRGRPVVVTPAPSKRLCAEEAPTDLEPMTDVVSLEPVEETEIEPAETTASEEAAQSAPPTQPSPRRKRGRPEVVTPAPSKRLCAEEPATGLEPMTDVVSLEPVEETEIEPTESTALEEAAQSVTPTSSSPRRKRGRPAVVTPASSKTLCAEEEATGLEPMTDVVSFEPVEESEIEPTESTASEEAAQSAPPTQPSPLLKRGRPVDVTPAPSKTLCAEEEATGLEPTTDVVSLGPVKETEIEPTESTALEEAAQSAPATSSSPRLKRGHPAVVTPAPSDTCAEEEATGLEPVSDVVSLEAVEETEIEPAESTASEELAQSAPPTQPSPRLKRGRPGAVTPAASKMCAEEEATAAVTVSDVEEMSSSAVEEKPSGRKGLRKKQLKQAVPVGTKQTNKEADVPEGSCDADEETAAEPVKVAASPGKESEDVQSAPHRTRWIPPMKTTVDGKL